MGKSAVLKDLANHPGGYFFCTNDGILCRAYFDEPAQAAIVFADGSQKEFFLQPGREQRLDCDASQIDCVYVFRGENLLLISAQAAKRAFDRKMRNKQTIMQDPEPAEPENSEKTEQTSVSEQKRMFAQRRWPPPPAWETACYKGGIWQEYEAPAGC